MLKYLINQLDNNNSNISNKDLLPNELVQDVESSETLDSSNNQQGLEKWMNNNIQRENDAYVKLENHNTYAEDTLFGNYRNFYEKNNYSLYNIGDFKKYLLNSLKIHKDMSLKIHG
ncbi:hypothetical protein K492DRAFT_201446 [Lichtheimia hyalospora FSU 10163]|nr:hypothetical protein K492DRAFT_201446 [Lichtheimia hyalospora FSU 10163]